LVSKCLDEADEKIRSDSNVPTKICRYNNSMLAEHNLLRIHQLTSHLVSSTSSGAALGGTLPIMLVCFIILAIVAVKYLRG